jgi:hypothetical protein
MLARDVSPESVDDELYDSEFEEDDEFGGDEDFDEMDEDEEDFGDDEYDEYEEYEELVDDVDRRPSHPRRADWDG